MVRKPRSEFAGAVYHVISRGDRGEAIYQDDEDRLSQRGTFLLNELTDTFGVQAVAPNKGFMPRPHQQMKMALHDRPGIGRKKTFLA